MTAMSECMLLLTENDPRYTTTNLTKSGRRIVWPKAQSAQLNFAITPGIFALGIEFRVDRVAKLKAVRDQARADAERAEGAIERFGPTINTAGPQDVRQAGPQAHAHRVGRLPPRSPPRARIDQEEVFIHSCMYANLYEATIQKRMILLTSAPDSP